MFPSYRNKSVDLRSKEQINRLVSMMGALVVKGLIYSSSQFISIYHPEPEILCIISSLSKPQPSITFSNLIVETLEQGAKYEQRCKYVNGIVLVSLLLTLNIFNILFYCLYC